MEMDGVMDGAFPSSDEFEHELEPLKAFSDPIAEAPKSPWSSDFADFTFAVPRLGGGSMNINHLLSLFGSSPRDQNNSISNNLLSSASTSTSRISAVEEISDEGQPAIKTRYIFANELSNDALL